MSEREGRPEGRRHAFISWLRLPACRRPTLAAGWLMAFSGAAALALASQPGQSGQSGQPFALARARGSLVVGVQYLAPPIAAGAKLRTPERLDTVVAEKLGEQLGLPVKVVPVGPDRRAAALADGTVDVLLLDRVAGRPAPGLDTSGTVTVPAGYETRPKAVIRGDTPLLGWQQVAGHSICMSTAALQAQALATQWSATVRTYRVPSDALVAVREGVCDIGLIDDTVWGPLMQFPEWKKFSATLPPEGPKAERVWLVRADDEASARWLAASMKQWRRQGVWQAMADKWARDVAFDVYLDQEVPDCHG